MTERPEIDRWILSVLNTLVKNVDTCYNEYEPTKADVYKRQLPTR